MPKPKKEKLKEDDDFEGEDAGKEDDDFEDDEEY
nr:hypothetical protein [uncultured archaeon]